MEQRLSLVTLGVADVSRAQAFYEAIGWRVGGGVDDETDHVAFFQAGGMIVALWHTTRAGCCTRTARSASSSRTPR